MRRRKPEVTPFFSLCERQSLPFFGKAYVGYIAHEHILGLPKLTRRAGDRVQYPRHLLARQL